MRMARALGQRRANVGGRSANRASSRCDAGVDRNTLSRSRSGGTKRNAPAIGGVS